MTDKERYLLHTSKRVETMFNNFVPAIKELKRVAHEISLAGNATPEFVERYNNEVLPLIEKFHNSEF